MEATNPYSVENVKELEKRFYEMLDVIPKRKYTFPEIIVAFQCALARKIFEHEMKHNKKFREDFG